MASRIIDPCATFHFYEIFCILKFLLIKFYRDRKILPILLIKILRYKFFCKNEKLRKGQLCKKPKYLINILKNDVARAFARNSGQVKIPPKPTSVDLFNA